MFTDCFTLRSTTTNVGFPAHGLKDCAGGSVSDGRLGGFSTSGTDGTAGGSLGTVGTVGRSPTEKALAIAGMNMAPASMTTSAVVSLDMLSSSFHWLGSPCTREPKARAAPHRYGRAREQGR